MADKLDMALLSVGGITTLTTSYRTGYLSEADRRAIAADEMWLSPFRDRETLAGVGVRAAVARELHHTWKAAQRQVDLGR